MISIYIVSSMRIYNPWLNIASISIPNSGIVGVKSRNVEDSPNGKYNIYWLQDARLFHDLMFQQHLYYTLYIEIYIGNFCTIFLHS